MLPPDVPKQLNSLDAQQYSASLISTAPLWIPETLHTVTCMKGPAPPGRLVHTYDPGLCSAYLHGCMARDPDTPDRHIAGLSL